MHCAAPPRLTLLLGGKSGARLGVLFSLFFVGEGEGAGWREGGGSDVFFVVRRAREMGMIRAYVADASVICLEE